MNQSRYIVVEGPTGVGKTALARRLAESFEARLITEEHQANPFLASFYQNPGRYAFQTQVFFLLSRFRQLQELTQLNLFHQITVSDYLFDKDRIFASVLLSDPEFALYDQVFNLLRDRTPEPDLVIFLTAGVQSLKTRLKGRPGPEGKVSLEGLNELVESYNNYFFHYDRSPLLVVNTMGLDLAADDDNYGRILREIREHQKGVKHYSMMLDR